MRPLILAGFAVAAVGLFGLVLEHMVWASPQPIIESGPIKVMAMTDRLFPVATMAGVFAVAAGIALLYLGRPRKSGAAPE